MPHYLIHVGPHKTGTTYLQLRFDAVRQRLRQGGVAYPTMWNASATDPSHRGLMIGLRDGSVALLNSQFEAIWHDDPDYVLISGEGLNLLEPPAIELLKTIVGSNPVTIIFYCRRWSELLPSLWQEEVKHGHSGTLPEFLAAHVADPFASPVMNFAKRLDIYSNIFGRSAVRLVSYSNLGDNNVDLARHFFECFLPDHPRLMDDVSGLPVARPNQSFPPREVEIIRALNSIHMINGRRPDARLRNWYMSAAGRFKLTDLRAAIEEDRATLPFSDASADPQRLHDMLFAMYGGRMVQPSARRQLFSPKAADIAYFEQRYLAHASQRRTLEEVYAAFATDTFS